MKLCKAGEWKSPAGPKDSPLNAPLFPFGTPPL